MSETKTYKPNKNHVGYVSKSKAGNILITIEQDMVLKKGDKLIQRKPAEILESLAKNGVITEEQCETRKEKIPDWKLYEVSKMDFKD